MIVKKKEDHEDYKFLSMTFDEYKEAFNHVHKAGFKEYRGFAVQDDKGKGNKFFPAFKPSPYEEVYDNGFTVNCPVIPLFNNILDAYKAAKDYMQVMSGLNHFRRDVMTCDCDKDFTEDTIEYFNTYCKKFDIPKPNRFVRNPKTNHYQVQWYLKDGYKSPYAKGKNYVFPKEMHFLRHEMNILLGDDNFSGGFIKNPFNPNLECYVNSNEFVDKTALEIGFNKAFIYKMGMSYQEYYDDKHGCSKSTKNNEKSVKKSDFVANSSRSRHQESGRKAITAGYEYMRSHNGNIDADFIKDKIIEYQWEVVREIKDPARNTIEPMSIINRQVKDVVRYCKVHFDKKGKQWNHERGTEIKVLKGKLQAIKINYLKEQGKTTKQIAEELGYSTAGVNRNIRENKDDIEGCFETVKTFYGQNKNKKDESNTTMCNLIKEVFDYIGYEFAEEEEIIAMGKDEVSIEEVMDALFTLFDKAIITLPSGTTIYNSRYNIKQKIKPKVA